MKKQITCIVCPRGCRMTAEVTENGIVVTGNTCKNSEQHAIAEVTNPVRTLTSSVRVENRTDTMVSVKSQEPISKGKLAEAMDRVHSTKVQAPIHIGDVILSDFFGTNLVATKSIV